MFQNIIKLSEMNKLPNYSGIYFVYHYSELFYIGASVNIKSRWRDHHIKQELLKKYKESIIKCFPVKKNELKEKEKLLIKQYKPKYNGKTRELNFFQWKIQPDVNNKITAILTNYIGKTGKMVSKMQILEMLVDKEYQKLSEKTK